ncbi:MAG: TlpA family protein disulfide reductase [Gammaproteobacteria bacterium]|nr:TlpA family protein disulfide reductase [Gammaproteobacteria bacterium]
MELLRFFPLILIIGVIGFVQASDNDLVLADVNNIEHRLSDYRGKWVVVNYWATWCPPCVEEMPELEFFYQNYKDKAMVLGVNMEDAPVQKVKAFVEEHMISYPILLAEPDRRGPLGEIPALPTTFIISPEGKIVKTKIGKITMRYLETIIGVKKSGKISRL